MKYALYFIIKYFWLFSGFGITLIGDVLFIIKSIQDVNETMRKYNERGRDKKYLKGKFVAPTICICCNIVIILMLISFLIYASEHMI